MDFRFFTPEGLTVCPNCHKAYKPVLGDRPKTNQCIQDQFPNATNEEREQLLTGLCSTKCWNQYLGISKRNEYE